MASVKGLNPNAAPFFPINRQLLSAPPPNFFFYSQTLVSASSYFPTSSLYLNGYPSYEHLSLPTEPIDQAEELLPLEPELIVEVGYHQQTTIVGGALESIGNSKQPAAELGKAIIQSRRSTRTGGRSGFFRRNNRVEKTVPPRQWKPLLKKKEDKIGSPKYVADDHSGTNWKLPRKMTGVKKFSDVLPVKEDSDCTTVMIKNIPNKYSRDRLIEFLDKHCYMENGKPGSGEEEMVESAFDFLYLPMDFRTGLNKGYAFVNFTNPKAVWRFKQVAHRRAWDDEFHSRKIREIALAKIQGTMDLVRHFNKMGFPSERKDIMPISFRPARDGSKKAVDSKVIGRPLEGWNCMD